MMPRPLLLTRLDEALDRPLEARGLFDDMLKKPCPYHKTQ
jgi:exonuclease VII large subunit